MVVDCVLCDGRLQTLKLFYAKPPYISFMQPIVDAEVELFDRTEGVSAGIFTNKGSTKEWILEYEVIPGHDYRIEVRLPGKKVIFAEDSVPERPQVIAFHHVPSLADPWINSALNHSSIVGTNNAINGPGFKYGDDFEGMTYSILSSQESILWASALTCNQNLDSLETTSIICTDYSWVDNFNITGEIYNPFEREFLSGVDVWNYGQLAGLPVHSQFLRFNYSYGSEQYDTGEFLISADFLLEDRPDEAWHSRPCYILFTSVSESYDQYICDAMRLNSLQNTSDMSALYLRENIYSNINGGIGIFGSKSCLRLPWCWSETLVNK